MPSTRSRPPSRAADIKDASVPGICRDVEYLAEAEFPNETAVAADRDRWRRCPGGLPDRD